MLQRLEQTASVPVSATISLHGDRDVPGDGERDMDREREIDRDKAKVKEVRLIDKILGRKRKWEVFVEVPMRAEVAA